MLGFEVVGTFYDDMDKLCDFGYDIIKCDADPNKREDLNDGTGRFSKKECVLPRILKDSLVKLNPNIPEEIINDVLNVIGSAKPQEKETEFQSSQPSQKSIEKRW